MSKKNQRTTEAIHLQYILESCEKIIGFMSGNKGYDRLQGDWLVQDAITGRLHKVLESTGYITEERQLEYATIDWKTLKKLRNDLVHDYLGETDVDALWAICRQTLPELHEVASDMLTKYHAVNTEQRVGYGR